MYTRRNRARLFATVIGFSLCAFTARAQNTADIVGTVRDMSDAVVNGAKITIKNVDTNVSRSSATSGTGEYSFSLLPVGTYSVTVEVTGFKRYTVPSVTVAAGDVKRVDAKMEVGSVAQSERLVPTRDF